MSNYLDEEDVYQELKQNFGGYIPQDVKEALDKELDSHNKDLHLSEPVVEFFKGKEYVLSI